MTAEEINGMVVKHQIMEIDFQLATGVSFVGLWVFNDIVVTRDSNGNILFF
jgi:hypothetical protein